MSEENRDYLWDGSGMPDPEVVRLESLLGRYRLAQPLREIPEVASLGQRLWRMRALQVAALAGAVAAVLVVLTPWLWPRIAQPGPTWSVKALEGDPQINGTSIRGDARLAAGNLLQTDSASRAEVQIGLIGRIEVLPGTRLRMVETRRGRHRMALERGKIAARTWAPPFTFVVDTPSATAYDLGCAFTLEAEESGVGLLRVTSGWVQIEFDDAQSLIPAGAASAIRPGARPGTPYFEDASSAFRQALLDLDFARQEPAVRAASLRTLLFEARRRDVYTLIVLLKDLPIEERARVFNRAEALLPLPAGTTRAGILQGNEQMHDAWVHQLGLGNAKRWWVYWKDILPR